MCAHRVVFHTLCIMLVGWLALAAPGTSASGGIVVEDAWARPDLGGNRVSAAYLVVLNRSGVDDEIVAAQSDEAERVELHTVVVDGNVMKMRRIEALAIPAGEAVRFAPGGHHLMLTGLARRLKKGDKIVLTLRFREHPPVAVTAVVAMTEPRGAGSRSSAAGSGDGRGSSTGRPSPGSSNNRGSH